MKRVAIICIATAALLPLVVFAQAVQIPGGGGSGISQAAGDARYLMLDASNAPVTGELNVAEATDTADAVMSLNGDNSQASAWRCIGTASVTADILGSAAEGTCNLSITGDTAAGGNIYTTGAESLRIGTNSTLALTVTSAQVVQFESDTIDIATPATENLVITPGTTGTVLVDKAAQSGVTEVMSMFTVVDVDAANRGMRIFNNSGTDAEVAPGIQSWPTDQVSAAPVGFRIAAVLDNSDDIAAANGFLFQTYRTDDGIAGTNPAVLGTAGIATIYNYTTQIMTMSKDGQLTANNSVACGTGGATGAVCVNDAAGLGVTGGGGITIAGATTDIASPAAENIIITPGTSGFVMIEKTEEASVGETLMEITTTAVTDTEYGTFFSNSSVNNNYFLSLNSFATSGVGATTPALYMRGVGVDSQDATNGVGYSFVTAESTAGKTGTIGAWDSALFKLFNWSNHTTELMTLTVNGFFRTTLLGTMTNCIDIAGDAACSAAPAGMVVVDAADADQSTVVSTTAVTADSEIMLSNCAAQEARYDAVGATTCNTTRPGAANSVYPEVSAVTAGTSFTITTYLAASGAATAPTTNPQCICYTIIN